MVVTVYTDSLSIILGAPAPVTCSCHRNKIKSVSEGMSRWLGNDMHLYRRLVEVWIPSVIKKGRGPEGFHVYQARYSAKECIVYITLDLL